MVQQLGSVIVTQREIASIPSRYPTVVYPSTQDTSSIQEQLSRLIASPRIDTKLSKPIFTTPSLVLPDLPERKEVYDPRFGAYIFTDPSMTKGTTIVTRQPTISEIEKMRAKHIEGGLFDRPSSEIITERKASEKRYAEFEKLSKEMEDRVERITELEKENVDGEYWIGSEEDFEKYQKEFDKHQKTISDIESIQGVKEREGSFYFEEEEIPVSLPFFKDTTLFKVPISSFTAKTGVGVEAQALSEGVGVLGEKIGKGVGLFSVGAVSIGFSVLGEEKVISPRYFGETFGEYVKRPSTLLDKWKFRKQPEVTWDLGTGEARLTKEGEIIKSPLIERVPKSFIITKPEAIETARTVGETAFRFGKYFIPVAGKVFWTSDIERALRQYDYKPLEFIKKEPVQAGILGGVLFLKGASKLYKTYKTPIFIQRGREITITTRGQRFFGSRVSIPLKSGEKFKILPPTKSLRLTKQPIGVGQLPESIKKVTPRVLSLDDPQTYKVLDQYITPIKDTRGVARYILSGEKTIAYKPTSAKIRIGFKELKYVPSGEKIIFRGLSPYTKAGKIERFELFREFGELGVKSDIVKPLIKLRYPKVIETRVDITGTEIVGEKGARVFLKAKEVTTFPKIQFTDKFGTITTRTGKSIERTTTLGLTPSGTTKAGEPIWKGISTEVTPSKPLGKTTELFDIRLTTKKVGEIELPIAKTRIGEMDVSRIQTFEIYKQPGISIRTVPKARGVEASTADIFLRKPSQKDIIDLTDQLGLKSDVGFVRTKGIKSSEQYLQSLYTEQRDVLATGLGIVTKKGKIPKPSPIKTFQETTTPTASIWVGTGMYERTEGVSGMAFNVQEKTLSQIYLPSVIEQARLDTKQDIKLFSDIKVDTRLKSEIRTDIKTQLKILQEPRIAIKEKLAIKERLAIRERLALRERLAIRERLALREMTVMSRMMTPSTIKSPKITPISPKTPKIGLPLLASKTKKKGVVEEDEDLFSVFVRKMGKDIEIGGFRTLPEAKKKLFGTIREELRASGFIQRKGEPIRIDIGGTEFRPSKVESFRIVEPRERRIKRKSKEAKEIQFFRKQSRKGGFF